VLGLLQSNAARITWVKLGQPEFPCRHQPKFTINERKIGTAIYYVSFLGLTSLLSQLLECPQLHSPGEIQGVIKLLVNAQGGHCGNALQAASFWGDLKVVRYLLERGANANAQGGRYRTALASARELRNDNIINALVLAGAKELWELEDETLLAPLLNMSYVFMEDL